MPKTREPARALRLGIEDAVHDITTNLTRHATAERAAQEKRYLKSELTFLGVTMPEIRREAKAFTRAHEHLRHDDLLTLTHALWQPGIYELRSVAVGILELEETRLTGDDTAALIALIRQAKTWALVDWLATKVLGPIIEREPRAKRQLDRWARDEDFWVRRMALLCLHDSLLAGAGDFDHFAKLATPMLAEREFFIRKAIGWVLRSTAKRTPERTYAYVAQHAGELAGLTFKEATRNLPAKQIAALSALRTAAIAARASVR
jgi:3-methyladenine DNA glycosylase AlkD